MINERRYILIQFSEVTQEIIADCIQTPLESSLKRVRFSGDATDWVMLKWRGDKPEDLWSEFPVYSDQEMKDILLNDLNYLEALQTFRNGTANQ